MKKNTMLMKAAIVGLMGAASLVAVSAHAADAAGDKGHCMGANACKGQGGCKVVGQNECAGQGSCKGKGFLEKTKAECDQLSKKNKKIHFETAMTK